MEELVQVRLRVEITNMIVGTKYHFFSVFHTDINECIEGSLCEQECTNTAGSYNCSCYTGYILANNEISCTSRLLIVFISLILTHCICIFTL